MRNETTEERRVRPWLRRRAERVKGVGLPAGLRCRFLNPRPKGKPMDEKFVAQLIAELKQAQGQALGLLTQALCQQVDPARLKSDLQRSIAAAKQLPSMSPIAVQIATQALAAAHAEQMLQAKPPSEGPHPKREG